ncbi:hypothetical protein GCM10011324_22630 [Allosediminivita pacifica]|nr:hypothetical protein GCM10011324_22630 [Allosediminivita pacifica]
MQARFFPHTAKNFRQFDIYRPAVKGSYEDRPQARQGQEEPRATGAATFGRTP